jgi:hypothetical protein
MCGETAEIHDRKVSLVRCQILTASIVRAMALMMEAAGTYEASSNSKRLHGAVSFKTVFFNVSLDGMSPGGAYDFVLSEYGETELITVQRVSV